MNSNSTPGTQPTANGCEADQFFRQLNIEFLIHELKDPLSIIETATLLLLDKQDISGPLTHRQEKTLQRILRSSRNVRSMVYDLLEVGRAGAVCFMSSVFNPHEVILQVLADVLEVRDVDLHDRLAALSDVLEKSTLLASKNIYVNADEDARLLELVHDKIKFSQIMANLLKNAFSYRRQALHIVLRRRNALVEILVGDDGPGIDPIHQEAVFERYKQVAPEDLERRGHGLGLAMSRILARSMGGDLTLQSQTGAAGAVFQLQLPIQAPNTR